MHDLQRQSPHHKVLLPRAPTVTPELTVVSLWKCYRDKMETRIDNLVVAYASDRGAVV